MPANSTFQHIRGPWTKQLQPPIQQVPDVDLEDQQTSEAIITPNMTGDMIIKKALEYDAAAVVMASHNKGPIAEFFHGSVTNYCSHHCPKPVSNYTCSKSSTFRQKICPSEFNQPISVRLKLSGIAKPPLQVVVLHNIPRSNGAKQDT